jgi:hypothetical protein
MADATRQRVERLRGLEAEALAAAGYGPGVGVPPDVRERCHMAAVLRVAYEQTEARLLAGQPVSSDELLRITEAVNGLLPPRRVEPLTIKFIDTEGGEERRLKGRIAELEQRLVEKQHTPVPAAPAAVPAALPAGALA